MIRLEDYLLTLDICRGALPPEHIHRHYQWLRKIERIVRRTSTYNQCSMIEGKLAEPWYAFEAHLSIFELSRPVPASDYSIRHARIDSDKYSLMEGKLFEPWYALEAYLPTFAICHTALSSTANYIHHQRLIEIEHFFRRMLTNNDRRRLARVEAWYGNDALGG